MRDVGEVRASNVSSQSWNSPSKTPHLVPPMEPSYFSWRNEANSDKRGYAIAFAKADRGRHHLVGHYGDAHDSVQVTWRWGGARLRALANGLPGERPLRADGKGVFVVWQVGSIDEARRHIGELTLSKKALTTVELTE